MPIITQAEKESFAKIVSEGATLAFVNSVIINTFLGSGTPPETLGKDGDIFKSFPGAAPVVVMDELSDGNYDANNLFEVFYDLGADDLWQVKIGYSLGVVLLKYGANGTPNEHEYTIQIGSGTIYDAYLYSRNSEAITLKFPVAANADIQSITTSTNIKISSKRLSGKIVDFVKYSGVWFENVLPFARPTATTDFIHHTPDKLEIIAAFNSIAQHDFSHQHDFYIKNNQGEFLVHYHPNGDTDESGINYKFYIDVLDEVI